MRNSQSPSIHAIYSNALPFYLDRADLNSIATEASSFASSFLQQLLAGTVVVQFDASATAADKVRHLYFESKNLSKILGVKSFGFGYPLLIDTMDGELFIAPLFIWQMSLEPAQTKIDAWVLRFDQQQIIQPNYQVIQYLKEKFDIDYTAQYEEVLKNKGALKSQVKAFCETLALRFQFDIIEGEEAVMDAPGIDEIGDYTKNGSIHYSGIFGIYPPQHKNWKVGSVKPEDVFVNKGAPKDPDEFVFPFVATDPEQVSALEHVLANSTSVVEGVDILGKTQTLLNLLLTSLMQGKRCLVVSEKSPALKRTQDMLSKAGIQQLNFLLTDAINDQEQLLELLRLAAKGTNRDISLDEKDWQYKKNKFLREKKRLDDLYQSVQSPVFGADNWTATVGRFLASNQLEAKDLLANHLNKNDFVFETDEHQQLKSGIEACNPLFTKVKTLNHPLSNLNDRVFQQISVEQGHTYVKKQLSLFHGKSRELHHEFITTTSNYRSSLKSYYEDYIVRIEGHFHKVQEKVLEYNDQLGKDFKEAGPRTFNIPIFFSKKKKRIIAAQQEVAKLYKSLKRTFEKDPYFDYQFSAAKEGMQMDEVANQLNEFETAFAHWKGKLDDLLQEELNRLNSKTAHPALGVKEEMSQLEFSLDVFLEELNDANLYQEILTNKTLTIPKRQKFLESIMEQMENTQLYLQEFPLFYQWQAQWLQLGGLGQKVVKALVKVKPRNWVAAFESWYFSNLLERKQVTQLPTNLEQIEQYDQSWHALKPLLLTYIDQLWQKKQAEGLRQLKKEQKAVYQQIFDRSFLRRKTTAPPLEILFQDSMEVITAFLPVLFVNSHVALNVLPKSYQFDLVIYDEANRFSIEPSTDIAELGKQIVIFGSNDSNGNETSLLQYAMANEVPVERITNKYEAPVQFLSNLESTDAVFHFAQKCRVEGLEGRFHEIESTNDTEAQHIIKLLNQIKQTPQRVFPTVGIVAFTIEQRNLISSYILQLKQQNAVGSEKIRQLERNGMGVFYVEELYGQQFDVLILSCTFGAIDLKGKLTKKMALLNTLEGESYMHLLINMPLQELYMVHSFTDAHLKSFSGKKWDKGAALMAHFIHMAEAAQAENEVKFMEELEALGKKEQRDEQNQLFVKEVAQALKGYIDENRIKHQMRWEDIVLPLVVLPEKEGAPSIILHPDGFFADTTYTSGVWEQVHLNKLKENNFEIIPIWSVNWFKDAGLEIRKLASQIIKNDGLNKDEDRSAASKTTNKK